MNELSSEWTIERVKRRFLAFTLQEFCWITWTHRGKTLAVFSLN